ncbi:MAG: hypothetical protein PHX20_03565 [Candidatus Omnitrophica bacterium]|nr:hypothetical protein [Candidatus Omnitrophota bacterium]
MISVLVDNNVLICWLNRTLPEREWQALEKIRLLSKEGKIKTVISIEIWSELIEGADCDQRNRIFDEWKLVRGGSVSQDFNVSDDNGSYNKCLTHDAVAWNELSNLIYDAEGSEDITGENFLSGSCYFLTWDDPLMDKVRKEGIDFPAGFRLVKPLELARIFDNLEL